MKPWRVLKSEVLVARPFLQLREEHVQLPNGVELRDFCVVETPPWAAVVCVTPALEVILVRQYRHGIGGTSLELPAGGIEPGEVPLAAAQRELREETGFTAPRWRALGPLAVDPSRHSTQAHFFAALDAVESGPIQLDPSEQLTPVRLPAREALERAARGGICHGLHVAALFRAQFFGMLD